MVQSGGILGSYLNLTSDVNGSNFNLSNLLCSQKAGYMDTQLSPANAFKNEKYIYVILVWCWLRGYAVVKTSPPPWYMLIGNKATTQL